MDNMPRAVSGPRVSRRDKRRNRRRKSSSRPLFSIAHALVAIQLALVGVFVFAVAQGLQQGANLTLPSAQVENEIDLALPGAAPVAPSRGHGLLQYAVWLYLAGTPLIFALLRGTMWRRVAQGAKYLVFTCMMAWCVVIMVILVTSSTN
ncbi:MAG: hypothetical protein AAF192_16190 [Pseudomonadota bacterium]